MTEQRRDLRAVEYFVNEVATLKTEVRKLQRAARLGNAAIDAGSLTMKDQDGNPVAVWDTTGGALSVTYPSGPTPATPTAPAVVGVSGGVVVQWDGTYSGEQAAPTDLAGVHVYAQPATGVVSDDEDDPVDPDLVDEDWAPDLSTLVGTTRPDGGTVSANVDPGEYEVRLVAVTLAGVQSEPTAPVTVTVPAILDDPEVDAALVELDQQLADAAVDLARVSGLYTTSTDAPTAADGVDKPDGAWWVQLDGTGAQVATWAWSEATGAWVKAPLTPEQIPALDVGKLVASSATVDTAVINKIWAGILTVRNIIADAINGKTITGTTIFGGLVRGATFALTGAGTAPGEDDSDDSGDDGNANTGGSSTTDPTALDDLGVIITNNADGPFIGFTTSRQGGAVDGKLGSIRAVDGDTSNPDNNIPYNRPAIVIRPPADATYKNKSPLILVAGPSGSKGILDVGTHMVLRGEVLSFKGGTTSGLTNLVNIRVLNRDTSSIPNVADRATIISQGVYNRSYTATANMIVTPNGAIGRATSLSEFKLDVEPLPPEQVDALLNVTPVWWFDRTESEQMARWTEAHARHDGSCDHVEDVPYSVRRIPGVTVEDARAKGATSFITQDENGNDAGFAYDRAGVALLGVVKELRETVASQADLIADLTERLEALEAKE
ncbi:hypothetical protein [Galactobacter sp.]|uniref:hypothetical protein n=1 Tax=Galactobacter sp. TaxID=2676125 RepID=UPI0025C00CA7|nr:hypothetical protein [Galactobacter sp.]